ncbi:hypothetical protein RQP46_004200 [Phenoliferia psychrophenolica]
MLKHLIVSLYSYQGLAAIILASTITRAATVTANAAELVLSSSFVISSTPTTRTYDWTIDQLTGAPDGFEKSMLVVNGQYPGPLIEANQGDTIVVKVQNNLVNGTSIHWHGILQNGTNWEDGPVGVSQCPIPPGGSFTYNFTLNGAEQYGTYWYHAHRGGQYADGIAGPLVVHSVNDPLVRGTDFDVDQVVVLSDNYHSMSAVILDALINDADGFQGSIAAPAPNSGLINGVGVYNCSLASATDTCTTNSPLEIELPPNSKVRLRFISVSAHAMFRVSATGQRYSVILDTSSDVSGDSFFLRSHINTDCFGASHADLDSAVLAIIRIVDTNGTASTDTPTSADWSDVTDGACLDLDEGLLVPRVSIDAPTTVDQTGVLNMTFAADADNDLRWNINGVTFETFIYDPLLLQVMNGSTIDSTKIPYLQADSVQTIDIILNNILAVEHPCEYRVVQRLKCDDLN